MQAKRAGVRRYRGFHHPSESITQFSNGAAGPVNSQPANYLHHHGGGKWEWE